MDCVLAIYSPLCDVDKEAYDSFLATVRYVSERSTFGSGIDGWGIKRLESRSGAGLGCNGSEVVRVAEAVVGHNLESVSDGKVAFAVVGGSKFSGRECCKEKVDDEKIEKVEPSFGCLGQAAGKYGGECGVDGRLCSDVPASGGTEDVKPVPEWRRGGVNRERNRLNKERKRKMKSSKVVQENLELRCTMEKKWMAENLLAAEYAEKKLAEMKESVVKVDVVSVEEQTKQVEKIRTDTARIRKQRERMEKEMADGIVAKEVAAKSALLDGQLSGKYSLVAPRHVIGFAQTVVSGGTGSSSSDGRKSVWSGTGASKLSSAPSVVSLEAKVSKLELSLRMVTSEKVLLSKKLREIEERDSHGFNGNW